jgi:hypothetical protein
MDNIEVTRFLEQQGLEKYISIFKGKKLFKKQTIIQFFIF